MESMLYAALRFTEDPNLRDRVYWYAADFPLKEGERVFAPVGPHDRIQRARVEAVRPGSGPAPYDAALLKHVLACNPSDFGGFRYDDRHYTRFGLVVFADDASRERFFDPSLYDERIYRAIALGHGVALIGGEGEEIKELLQRLMQRDARAEAFLNALGFGEETCAAIRSRLG